MKISEISGVYAAGKASTNPAEDSKKKEGDFGRVLDQELAPDSTAISSQTQLSLDSVGALSLFPGVQQSAEHSAESEMADSIDSTLEQFEGIGEKLQDSSASPKDVNETISNLLDKADSLAENLKALPDEHPLKQIGNELSILAHMESIKWSRGEYL